MAPTPLDEAIAHNKARCEDYGGHEYLRLTDDFHGTPRGSAAIQGRMIVGYPSIGRILRLDTGLAHQFRAPFWVEEKVDGYNVRILRLDDEVLALTRGGFVCPFTTDRLPDLIDLRILEEHPGLVLCAEVAGPEQPYVSGHPPFIREDVELFLFDIMQEGRAGCLPQREKYRLVERYGLPTVGRFGRHAPDRPEALHELVRQLDREGREGVVMKEDSERDHRAKYVTGYSCVDDIRATVDHLRDLPPEYFTGRIMRLALYLDEVGETGGEDLREELGSALLDGLFGSIEQSRRESRVYRRHRCRFRHLENAKRLLKHLKRADGHLHVAERRLEREGDYYVLEFDKLHAGMTGLLGHVLGGGLVFD
jgi:putative ATP-dependent DNA ligase